MSASTATGRTLGSLVRLPGPRTWAATGQLLLAPLAGLFWTGLGLGLLTLAAATAIIVVGFPIALGALLLGRVGARAERAVLRATLGTDIPAPVHPRPSGLLSGLRTVATDGGTWRSWAWLALLVPLGAVEAALVIALWVAPVALVTLPLWYRLPEGGGAPLLIADDGRALVVVDTLPEALAGLVAGLALAVLAGWAVRGLAAVHATIAAELLGPGRRALTARVQTLQVSRARAMDAAAAERRRIERDLHDGAQARLVALAMDLGMAKEKFDTDPDAARELMEMAHAEAKRAIVELRDLARGIHPAVLTDRGLDAALSALAGRSPVPVEVSVELPARLPESVEVVAYYVVAEGLVNVARHAGATRAWVTVRPGWGIAVIEVGDDGGGGAEAATAEANGLGPSGLAGLADRVAAVDGRLTVNSPPGGPTVLRAELPVIR
jgi:signal transduction histidine kinase